jgi:hypothetical protein
MPKSRCVVFVVALVFAAAFSPAGVMVARSDAAGAAPPGARVEADFNGDGAEDLAVGAPFERVGSVPFAGSHPQTRSSPVDVAVDRSNI